MSPQRKISKLQESLLKPDLTKRDLGEKRELRLSTRGKQDWFEPGSSRKAIIMMSVAEKEGSMKEESWQGLGFKNSRKQSNGMAHE